MYSTVYIKVIFNGFHYFFSKDSDSVVFCHCEALLCSVLPTADGADSAVSCPQQMVLTKEYILVIEVKAPVIVLQRCDSPNLFPLFLQILNYLNVCQSRHGEVG